MYSELFKLFGYEQEEIEQERPRIDKAFKILEIGPEDIKRAEKRVVENFDTELVGARKLLGLWVKEFLNLVLAKEEGKRLVYCSSPPFPLFNDALQLASKDKNVIVAPPNWLISFGLGAIFDKIAPVLEAGEEMGLRPGAAHCSFNQIDLGSIAKGIVPVPAMAINYRYFCDQGAEVTEMLHMQHGVPIVYADYCPDIDQRKLSEVPHRQIKYFGGELRRAFERFEEVMGFEVKEEHKREALAKNGRYWMSLQTLLHLLRKSDPLPLGVVELAYLTWTSFPSFDKDKVVEVLKILIKEVKQRIAEGKGVVEKGSPRIYLLAASIVDPTVMRMMEKMGLAIPLVLFSCLTPEELTPLETTIPEEQMAEFATKRGVFKGSIAWIEYAKALCKGWDLDGAILTFPFSCRPFSTVPIMMKKDLREEFDIPVLVLEMDVQDPRDYSAGQLRTRVETFAEILKARKAARG